MSALLEDWRRASFQLAFARLGCLSGSVVDSLNTRKEANDYKGVMR